MKNVYMEAWTLCGQSMAILQYFKNLDNRDDETERRLCQPTIQKNKILLLLFLISSFIQILSQIVLWFSV